MQGTEKIAGRADGRGQPSWRRLPDHLHQISAQASQSRAQAHSSSLGPSPPSHWLPNLLGRLPQGRGPRMTAAAGN